MNVRHLYWKDIAPDTAFHAALGIRQGGDEGAIPLHDHDFCELFLVTEGKGEHNINNTVQRLSQGHLVFIRPPDCHTLRCRSGERLHWINVAFPLVAWRDFQMAAGIPAEINRTALPPARLLPLTRYPVCEKAFQQTLRRFRGALNGTTLRLPDRLELCGFLAAVLPFLLGEIEEESGATLAFPATTPDWLLSACRIMAENTEYLRQGLPRLRLLTGRTEGHLARSLKGICGQTPTEFINELRLRRAALLLTTTALPITIIAAECGFEQLSYFYRLFNRRFHLAPHAYRQAASKPVTSGSQ